MIYSAVNIDSTVEFVQYLGSGMSLDYFSTSSQRKRP